MNIETAPLVDAFSQTVSPDPAKIKHAEQILRTYSLQPGFGIAVLRVVASEAPIEIRQAAAVNFKNLTKQRWVQHEESDLAPLPDAEKDQVKSLITDLMLSTPLIVRAQLSEALSIISMHDFPNKWPDLLPRLIQKLQTGDPATINGVLHTLNSIYKRLRGQMMTDALSIELEVSQQVVKPLLHALEQLTQQVLQKLTQQVKGQMQDPAALKQSLSSVRLVMRVFYSMNSPGLTEEYETVLKAWFDQFHAYLTLDSQLAAETDPEKESVLDAVKAAVCQNLNLFIEMNEEEFKEYLQVFVGDVWQLLVSVKVNPGQDNLAMSAIRFLTTVARSVHYGLFQNEQTLQQICEQIIVPNLRIRDDDQEMFEMNWVEYVRRDTEGSDTDTRRRAATDLVKRLTEKFPKEVSALFTGYVAGMLKEYSTSPEQGWKAKDCAIFLVLALAVQGKTAAAGATSTNQLVDVGQFFVQHILPELQSPNVSERPILKADALKFLTTFRSQIPKEVCVQLFPSLVNLLGSESNVVHSYAAIAVERLLASKEGGHLRFKTADLGPVLQGLLGKLFGIFSLEDSSENEYAMKTIMRVISFVGPEIAPAIPACLSALAGEQGILMRVCQNPRQPGFNHYMFESVAALVRQGCASNASMVTQLEEVLFPPFQYVLQQDVQEFHPYIFQIFAQLIELHQDALPEVYLALLPGFMSPHFWERQGNVPALTRLMQAYLRKASPQIAANKQLEPLLGVFQKLNASKALDHEAFNLLEGLTQHLWDKGLQQYMGRVWSLLLTRLQQGKTTKYTRCFIAFLSLMIALHGPAEVESQLNTMQPGLLLMLLQQIVLPQLTPGFFSNKQQKHVEVALIKVLTEWPPLQTPQQAKLWAQLLSSLGNLLDGRRIPAKGGNDEGNSTYGSQENVDPDEFTGYTAAFAPLHNAAAVDRDPLAGLPERKQLLANSLATASKQSPGQLAGLVQQVPEFKEKILTYCQSLGVQLS